ncbi:MAG: oxidoreductase [Geodermatophilaceae bacterium]
MRLFGRKKGLGGGSQAGGPGKHLLEFVHNHQGVEAYLEPKTAVTEMTVVLVAADGEWTRRRVASADVVRKFGNKLGVPVYDVEAVGYPEKMREWTRKRKEAGDTGVPDVERS